ncbi:hypothetical protein PV10_08665 [Exophiala mesophila]|uniref:Uncharacterized protein n=1 Tax=Exophiala mesophila TaxID=212818 RepID=A0A0D1Z2S7_EXOME|nr:uncharacterized protein PV10_08665 [Exophiala mesophila]KIV89052.1 hypothetical protein PV10_08665 [Exophiala mesophila]
METPDAESVDNTSLPASSEIVPGADQHEKDSQPQVPVRTSSVRRGRHAKDPLGKSVNIQCQKVEDMISQLKDYLAQPVEQPEHTTVVMSFPMTAAFLVPQREEIPPHEPGKRIQHIYSPFKKTAVSAMDALHESKEPKEQAEVQRLISKALAEAVQQADGYRYSFHNSWLSREDKANRFSYYCNDSILNKGRAANEGAAMVRNSVKIRKQVYDCQGNACIKFSVTKMSLEVHYKHIPLHKTYDERAPPPRRDSKRRKLMEIYQPGLLTKVRGYKSKTSTPKTKAAPAKKRRATEPLPQPQPQSESDDVQPQPRESSLQPLFDFLGSADRVANESSPEALNNPPTDTATEEPSIGVENDSSTDAARSKPQKHLYPGMMSGFMSGNSLNWGPPPDRPKKRSQRRERLTPGSHEPSGPVLPRAAMLSYLSSPAEPFAAPPAAPPAAPHEVPPFLDAASQLEALRAQLEAAHSRIQDLEREKTQSSSTPIRWDTSTQRPSYPPGNYSPAHQQLQRPPNAPQAGYTFYPQMASVQYQYPPPPPQWPQPAPAGARPPPPPGPFPAHPQPGFPSGPAPAPPAGPTKSPPTRQTQSPLEDHDRSQMPDDAIAETNTSSSG